MTITGYEGVLLDGTYTTPAICRAYRAIVNKYSASANGRIQSGRTSAQGPYEAFDYRRAHPWVKDPIQADLKRAMSASATKALDALSGGRAGDAGPITNYLDDSVESCGLSAKYRAALAQTQRSDTLGRKIRSLAADRPWYPKGFHEWESGVAFRWIDNAYADCFSQCWYWTIEVVARSGCPSGVYGELNAESGGSVVDWTNDSLPYLAPRQRGRLQFITYSSAARGASGRMAEINCY